MATLSSTVPRFLLSAAFSSSHRCRFQATLSLRVSSPTPGQRRDATSSPSSSISRGNRPSSLSSHTCQITSQTLACQPMHSGTSNSPHVTRLPPHRCATHLTSRTKDMSELFNCIRLTDCSQLWKVSWNMSLTPGQLLPIVIPMPATARGPTHRISVLPCWLKVIPGVLLCHECDVCGPLVLHRPSFCVMSIVGNLLCAVCLLIE